jgi:hypothetical protein
MIPGRRSARCFGRRRELRRTRYDLYSQAKVLAVGRTDEHNWIAQAKPFCDSPRTRGVAVAVSASPPRCLAARGRRRAANMTVGSRAPTPRCSEPRPRRGARVRARSKQGAVALDSSVSGVVRTTRRPPTSSCSSEARRSAGRSRLWSTTTGTPRLLSARSWSAMRAISAGRQSSAARKIIAGT